MTGVTKVGVLANTAAPVPVSSVRTAAKFALDGVARNVATFAARPETPVAIGKPVQFVNVPEVGVPRIGVTMTMLVLVQALMFPLATVPSAGVTNAGLVNVPVLTVGLVIVGVVSVGLMLKTNTPVPVSSVIAASKFALDGVDIQFCTPAAYTVSALI